MRRWTMPALRREVWRRLVNPDTTIDLKRVSKYSAFSWNAEGEPSGEIVSDPYKVSTQIAVVHEILHWVLDVNLTPYYNYHVYELFINALEERFFRGMSRKERARWRSAIERKIRKSRLKES